MGQLVAIMDELHKCYCTVVRENKMPSTLIGNGLLGKASDSPAQALEELSDLDRVYTGWAKTVSFTKDNTKNIKINSARKLLRLAAPVCECLHSDPSLDKPLNSVQKAHLFLGYLAPVLGKNEDEIPETFANETEINSEVTV